MITAENPETARVDNLGAEEVLQVRGTINHLEDSVSKRIKRKPGWTTSVLKKSEAGSLISEVLRVRGIINQRQDSVRQTKLRHGGADGKEQEGSGSR